MLLAQAINHFRPEFGIRDQLRDACKKAANENTYFATIPKDICDIILEMVPDLRQTYTQEQFANARAIYDQFLQQYGSDDINPDPNCVQNLNRSKIMEGFNPDPELITGSNIIHFKMQHNNQIVVSLKYSFQLPTRIITHDANIPYTNKSNHEKYLTYSSYPRWILPCGLVLVLHRPITCPDENCKCDAINIKQYLLINPENITEVNQQLSSDQYIEIFDIDALDGGLLFDDFGNTINPRPHLYHGCIDFSPFSPLSQPFLLL